jgi:glycerol-3-phosphate acyltransferase PlsX
VVMDGFTGNITLKLIEGVSGRALRLVTETADTNLRGRLGSWLIGPTMQRLRDAIDPEGPGGAYMLGLRQLGVVAHGRFSARGFAQAIDVAARGVQHDVIGRTRAALQEAGALRPAPGRDGPEHERAGGPSEATATVSS